MSISPTRVAARSLQARKDPLDEKHVQKLRKEFLMLLRNADKAKTFDLKTAEKYRMSVLRWTEMFETYMGQIRRDLKDRTYAYKREDKKDAAKWAEWYLDNSKPLWDFQYELRHIHAVPGLRSRPHGTSGTFEEPSALRARLIESWIKNQRATPQEAEQEIDSYLYQNPTWTRKEAEEDAVKRWAEETRKWATRVRRKARAAWKYLDALVDWTERTGWYSGQGEPVEMITTIDERVNLEGFPMIFRGFDDASSFVSSHLEAFKASLKKYKQRAQKVLPLLLKTQRPFVVNWSWARTSGMAAATYERDRIEINPWGLGEDVDATVRLLAHEQAHHLYELLGRDVQNAWGRMVRGDHKDLDLRKVLKMLRSVGAATIMDNKIARKDPILYLQLETLLHDYRYKSRDLFSTDRIEEYLSEGGDPVVKVPSSPISGYAGKNENESFAEAVGHLVAYGPNRLPDQVLGWMKLMLPSVKFAAQHTAERFGPNTPLMEHEGHKVKYRVKSNSNGIGVGVYYGRARIGGMSAHETGWRHLTKCQDDMLALIERYPHIEDTSEPRFVMWGEEIPNVQTLLVYKAFIDDKTKHGLGIGRAMYLAIMAEWFDKVGPFLFMPMKCSGGQGTSAAAERVWKSLTRDFPSSGNVVAVLRRPRLPSSPRVAHRFLHPVMGTSTHDSDGRPLRQPSGLLRMRPDYGEGGANLPRGNPGEVEEVYDELRAMGMRVAARHPKVAKSYNRVAIYDFDGTMFRSWEKTPDWWKGTELDKGPFSFFVRPECLDEPCVPDTPGSDYWVKKVVASAKRDAADRNVVMVVVTGRVGVHKQRVQELLRGKGIKPQGLYFNPGMSAVQFKVAVLRSLLAMNPNITHVDVWENENQAAYKRALKQAAAALGMDVEVDVHSVNVAPKPLLCGPQDFDLSARVAAKYQKKKKVPKADGKGTVTVYEYSERQVQHRNREKAKRVEKLRGSLHKLRDQIGKDLKSKDPKTRLLALAVGLMNDTYERVGNAGSAKEGHFGVTVWQAKHVTLGSGKATFSYVGKSGVKQTKETKDKALIAVLREAMKGKSGTDNVFTLDDVSANASAVNAYLKQFDITAKDIRGLHANREMQTRLKSVRSKGGKLPTDKKEREKKLKDEFKEALEGAAGAVGHKPSTLKGQYLVPGLEDEYLQDGKVTEGLNKKSSLDLGDMSKRMFALDAQLSHGAQNWNHNLADVFKVLWRLRQRPDKQAKVLERLDKADWIRRGKRSGALAEIQALDSELARALDGYLREPLHKLARVEWENLGGKTLTGEVVDTDSNVLIVQGEDGMTHHLEDGWDYVRKVASDPAQERQFEQSAAPYRKMWAAAWKLLNKMTPEKKWDVRVDRPVFLTAGGSYQTLYLFPKGYPLGVGKSPYFRLRLSSPHGSHGVEQATVQKWYLDAPYIDPKWNSLSGKGPLRLSRFQKYLEKLGGEAVLRKVLRLPPKPGMETASDVKAFVESRTYMELEDESSTELVWTTRENGDVGSEEPGREDLAHARDLVRDIRKQFPGARVSGEAVDEWVSVTVRLPRTGKHATKTPAEREDDEAGRLVRQAPKKKPPRKDLRRQRMNVDNDRDPDQDQADKDHSRNFKDIGASVQTPLERMYEFSAWSVW